MTAFCSRRFQARIETLKNYILSDSLINEDYHTKLNDIENIAIALEKYMACNIQFLRLLEVIWRKRQTLRQVLNTFYLENRVGQFDYLAWFVFYARLDFEIRKNYPSCFFICLTL